MTQLFITSDEHIGHANIINLAGRPFTSLAEMKQTIITNHNKIFNCDKMHVTADHFARRVWQGSHKGHGHVYGHSHSALPGLDRSFDIGIDGNNFTPWAIEEIVAKLRTIPPHHTINNTGEGITEDVVNEGRGNSMGEHLPCKQGVAGSSPVPGSTVHAPGCVCGFCKMGSTSWT